MVNDFEFHVYNRSELYGQLQELFGLDPTIIPPKKEDDKARENGREQTHTNLDRYRYLFTHLSIFKYCAKYNHFILIRDYLFKKHFKVVFCCLCPNIL